MLTDDVLDSIQRSVLYWLATVDTEAGTTEESQIAAAMETYRVCAGSSFSSR